MFVLPLIVITVSFPIILGYRSFYKKFIGISCFNNCLHNDWVSDSTDFLHCNCYANSKPGDTTRWIPEKIVCSDGMGTIGCMMPHLCMPMGTKCPSMPQACPEMLPVECGPKSICAQVEWMLLDAWCCNCVHVNGNRMSSNVKFCLGIKC